MNWLTNLFGGIGKAAQGAGQSIMGGIGNLFGGGQQQQPQYGAGKIGPAPQGQFTTPPIAPSTSGGGTDWMSSLFPGGKAAGIAGLAAPAIGNLFAPKAPKIPDIRSLGSVQAMQNFRPGQSVSPAYQEMIQGNVGKLRDKRIQDLQALYHNARPGTDYLTDTNYQRDLALLETGVQDDLTNELTKAEGQFSSQEQDRLSQLAQLDVYTIMAQTGLEAQEAQQFKEMFSNVGNMFLTNATKKPGYDFASLFGSK